MTDNAGWIKLHRKILSWGWYKEPSTCHLFMHLLLRASHKPTVYKGQKIKRGQMLTSRASLAADTGLSQQNCRTAIERLKSTKELTSESTKHGTLLTIVNYEDYQEKEEKPTKQPTSTPTSGQPGINQPIRREEGKKDKKREEDNNLLSNTIGQERAQFNNDDAQPVYAFHGEVIKLLDKDYKLWKERFNGIKPIEFRSELERIDKWWQKQSPAAKKNWFFRTSKMLEKKNLERLEARPEPRKCALAEEYKSLNAPSIGDPGFAEYMMQKTGALCND